MARTLRYALLGAVVIGLLALGLDSVQMVRWIGATNLTIVFVVTDAETGAPIEGAEIFAHDEEDSSANTIAEKPRFKTDRDGVATADLPNQKCCGSSALLGLRNTRGVDLPNWTVLVKVPGYTHSDKFYTSQPYPQTVQHLGPEQDKLVFPISIRKAPP